MRLSITCTLIVHNVSKHWVMQSQPFMKPLTSFIKVLNFNCYLGDFRRSLLRNEMMININSNIFDVPTTGKTSVTTNKQWFWKQACDNTGDSRLFISLCFRYRPIFIFYFFFFVRPILCRSGQGSFSPSWTNFYCWKSRYFQFFFIFFVRPILCRAKVLFRLLLLEKTVGQQFVCCPSVVI